jgi:hypothetical protein
MMTKSTSDACAVLPFTVALSDVPPDRVVLAAGWLTVTVAPVPLQAARTTGAWMLTQDIEKSAIAQANSETAM